jgi:penicillin G amidase
VLLSGGYLFLLASLPQIEGSIEVAGLEAPVTIVRDRFAVPHIEAANARDAYFALGFVHAQDRLWQMEFQRRVGAGRLAEVVGAEGLPADRFMRLLGLYRLAEASLAHLEPETVEILGAYTAGVNAYLATRSGPLPLEFLLLRHRPEPWTPADSLVIVRLMALDLARNWREELLRARLAERLTPEQMADLWPPEPGDAPVTLAAHDAAGAAGRGRPGGGAARRGAAAPPPPRPPAPPAPGPPGGAGGAAAPRRAARGGGPAPPARRSRARPQRSTPPEGRTIRGSPPCSGRACGARSSRARSPSALASAHAMSNIRRMRA